MHPGMEVNRPGDRRIWVAMAGIIAILSMVLISCTGASKSRQHRSEVDRNPHKRSVQERTSQARDSVAKTAASRQAELRESEIRNAEEQTSLPEAIQGIPLDTQSAVMESAPEVASPSVATLQYDKIGYVSFYGKKFHGRKTASGEIFNKHDLTAAHRTLPFGTRVEVTHLRSGRKIVVRINDRGPFHKNRILDISRASAEQLGIVNKGVARARVRVVD